MHRCDAEGHGLVMPWQSVSAGLMVGLFDLKDLFQPKYLYTHIYSPWYLK